MRMDWYLILNVENMYYYICKQNILCVLMMEPELFLDLTH